METTDILAYAGLALFGLAFGALTMRSSERREKIRTQNALARLFHYLSCATLSALTPTILVTVLVVHPQWVTLGGITISPLVQLIGLVVVIFAAAILLLLLYAAYERPALAAYASKQQEQGWTAKDARESGL